MIGAIKPELARRITSYLVESLALPDWSREENNK
jgi:hypothetical protein